MVIYICIYYLGYRNFFYGFLISFNYKIFTMRKKIITLDFDNVLTFGKFKGTKITPSFLFDNFEYINYLYEEEIVNLSEQLFRDVIDLRLNKEINPEISLDYWDILHD